MELNSNLRVFFELIRIGLWGGQRAVQEFKSSSTQASVDWENVYQLAQEQSIQGLVLQGIETVQGSWTSQAAKPSAWLKVHGSPLVPKVLLLQWIGEVQVIEQRNKEMNVFVADLIEKLRKQDVYTLLVKGQGVAQCYKKPLWRSSGDIDFYMTEVDFQKAKKFFRPLVDKFDPDDDFTRHINMHYGEWVVEIHANQNCSLSSRINRVMREVHQDLFYNGSVRSWQNDGTQIFLPSVDNDVIIIFTHFFNHFYKGGVGLRQICDWCRLLWTYKDTVDRELLESRILKAGLIDEWKAFAVLAVDYLGMPIEAMPLLNDNDILNVNLQNKADRIMEFVMKVGNFGHNRDMSYYSKYPFLIRKIYSFGRRCGDLFRHARIFPLDSLRFFPYMMMNGIKAALNGVHNNRYDND